MLERDRVEKSIMGENDTERSELKSIMVYMAAIGIMFLGLWVFSQEPIHHSRLLGSLILSIGLGLYAVKACRA